MVGAGNIEDETPIPTPAAPDSHKLARLRLLRLQRVRPEAIRATYHGEIFALHHGDRLRLEVMRKPRIAFRCASAAVTMPASGTPRYLGTGLLRARIG